MVKNEAALDEKEFWKEQAEFYSAQFSKQLKLHLNLQKMYGNLIERHTKLFMHGNKS